MDLISNPNLRRALAERVRYYNELGIYDFYRREGNAAPTESASVEIGPKITTSPQPELREEMSPRKSSVVATTAEEGIFETLNPKPEHGGSDPIAALRLIREDLGDCTRCKLHQQGRKQIVFGVGNPNAELMFIGEAPGADEDIQGEPFVGRAGQLLTKIIEAIGLKREDVYIANVIKCRPPGNRNPEPDEVEQCEPFLFRQIDTVKPKVIVALGKFAAQCLLRTNDPITRIRGREFKYRDAILIPTYHPAYLLRTPSAKREVWEDMKRVRAILRGET